MHGIKITAQIINLIANKLYNDKSFKIVSKTELKYIKKPNHYSVPIGKQSLGDNLKFYQLYIIKFLKQLFKIMRYTMYRINC